METKHKVYLIGGTSHTGKSTIGQALSSELCWDYQPTDKLAQHPGRPWQTPPKQLKRFVAYHYQALTPEQLVADVERHYKRIVWPLALERLTTHACNRLANGLVLEGAALLPELIAPLDFENVASIWLTASNQFLKKRIHLSSEYELKSREEKDLIDKFLERTYRLNDQTLEMAETYELAAIDVEKFSDPKSLEKAVFTQLVSQGQPRFAESSFQ